MGIESATYVNDFDATLPTATDLRSQGDDHMRLIKTVLKNSLGGSTRQFQIPGVLSKVADYTVVKADGESTVYCTTAGGVVTFTLPTLAALDAGWKIHFIKTNSGVNPMFIIPPSGTINSGGISGLTKCRRGIPGVRITAIWDGTTFFVTRALALPIGSMIDFFSATLPAGFEWPNGQTLSSAANYPEYFNQNTGSGITYDCRGRVAVTLDNLGGAAAGRLPGGVINGSSIASVGGVDTVTLSVTQIPAGITSSASNAITVTGPSGHTLLSDGGAPATQTTGGGGFGFNTLGSPAGAFSNGFVFTGSNVISVTSNNTGGGSHSNLQPSIMCSKLVVVE